jgi:16S rRNA G966 N2-methylase RsmD/predicted RNA-binding Zn-ribbon protein involved in translation (DUF1610 family)
MVTKAPIQRSLVPASHPPHYLMHKYWARKPHNIVRAYIEHFCDPGGIVLDPFSGSGVTLIEALSSGRKAIAIDLNPVATLITEASVDPFDPDQAKSCFDDIQVCVKERVDHFYTTTCRNCGSRAIVNYYVWENVAPCMACSAMIPLGSAKKQGGRYTCSECGQTQVVRSSMIKGERIVSLNYSCSRCNGRKSSNKTPDQADFELLEELNKIPVKGVIKNARMFRNRRTLTHDNVTVESLFTTRNLYLLSLVKEAIHAIAHPALVRLFEFTFTSCIAQASRLIAFRNNLTTGGPAWSVPGFWIPNLHLELNPWNCFANRFERVVRGKKQVGTILEGNPYRPAAEFQDLRQGANAWILNVSSTDLDTYVPDESIDYIFTDPPYGDSVPYLEFSSLWNAWIDRPVDFEKEIVISNSDERHKDRDSYALLLKKVMRECYRVLKPGRWLSLTFNNRDIYVWKAIVDAAVEANFHLVNSVYQAPAVIPSKAQLAKAGSTTGDIILNFQKPLPGDIKLNSGSTVSVEQVIVKAAEKIIAERGGTATSDDVLRGVILALLSENQLKIMPEDNILRILRTRFLEKDSVWRLRAEEIHLIRAYPQLEDRIREIVRTCKNQRITDRRAILAEVFTQLQGSQTPAIKSILAIHDEEFGDDPKKKRKEHLEPRLAHL